MAALSCQTALLQQNSAFLSLRCMKQVRCPSSPAHCAFGRTLHTFNGEGSQTCRATADVEASPMTQSVLELDPVYEGEYCSELRPTRAQARRMIRRHDPQDSRGMCLVSVIVDSFLVCSARRDQHRQRVQQDFHEIDCGGERTFKFSAFSGFTTVSRLLFWEATCTPVTKGAIVLPNAGEGLPRTPACPCLGH